MVSQTPLFPLFSLPLPPAHASLHLLSFLPCCWVSVLPTTGFMFGTAVEATSLRLSLDTAHLLWQWGLHSSPCCWVQTQRKPPSRMFGLPGLTSTAAFCSPCLSEMVSVVACPPLPSHVLHGAVLLEPLSVPCHRSLVRPMASPHYRSLLSFLDWPCKDQGTSSAKTLLGDSSLSKCGHSGDWNLIPVWCSVAFRVSCLFRGPDLYYTSHNILFCCIPQPVWLCTASDVSCICFLPSVGAHPPFQDACGPICSQDGGWMGRETSASLSLSWNRSLQLLPAAGRTGNNLSPRADAHHIYCGEDGGKQEGCDSRLRHRQQNVSSPFCQGPSFIMVALCRWGGLPSVLGESGNRHLSQYLI